MAIHHAEIKKLCTSDELQWIDASFGNSLKRLGEADLKAAIVRGRNFLKKYRDLGRGQKRSAKRAPKGSDPREFFGDEPAQRTSTKSAVFAEALERYEEELAARGVVVSPQSSRTSTL